MKKLVFLLSLIVSITKAQLPVYTVFCSNPQFQITCYQDTVFLSVGTATGGVSFTVVNPPTNPSGTLVGISTPGLYTLAVGNSPTITMIPVFNIQQRIPGLTVFIIYITSRVIIMHVCILRMMVAARPANVML